MRARQHCLLYLPNIRMFVCGWDYPICYYPNLGSIKGGVACYVVLVLGAAR